ncbi:MAG: PHP domain-containing protein [Candidatus Omnitrophota bacterium]
MITYVPLRVYSVFSQGKGAVDPRALARYLVAQGISDMAVTDPFTVIGWEAFRREATHANIRFLPGMEIKVSHLGSIVLYPLTVKGYDSMIASLNNKTFSAMKDVIVICIPRRTAMNSAPVVLGIHKQFPPENVYLGLEWTSSRWVVDLAREHHIPLVWAQPIKWVDSPEKYAVAVSVFNHQPVSEILRGISSGELPFYGPMNGSAIIKRWGETGETAMKNTFKLAARIGFDFSDITPPPDSSDPTDKPSGSTGGGRGMALSSLILSSTPSYARSQSVDAIFEEVVNREMRRHRLTLAERERTLREIDIIKRLGFSSYFLIASEIGSYCRKKKIYFNLRGSGVSSFILYLLGLSRINPLHYDLLFERFVNSLRDDLPDIDIDIDSSRRAEVLKWVFDTYKRRVVFVSTHKFFRARSALYEVARSYGINVDDAHKMTKDIPMFESPIELLNQADGKGQLAEIYRMASLLEGVYKELSLHVGGVLFSEDDISRVFPLERSPQGFDQTIWDKEAVERLRIFKLDLLGVRGFDVIAPVALEGNVDYAAPDVWENIQKARTIGCFQLESPLIRKHLVQIKPKNLQEIAISIAVIRPGPSKSGMKDAYIDGAEPMHPVLMRIFPYTRGTVIFEEQISVLLHAITGWNLEYSEKIRRALKKRKGEPYRDDFFARGRANGWSWSDLEKIWKLADDFSQYAFNHGHSISYAFSAYLSAWFKTRYPSSFFCRLLNSGGGFYPLPVYIEEAKRWGISIFPPDINKSVMGFSEENGAIRTGFVFVKGIGVKMAEQILDQRGMGYTSLEDFIGRTRIGERELATLMAVSGFQSIGINGFSPEERQKNWKSYLGFVPDEPSTKE